MRLLFNAIKRKQLYYYAMSLEVWGHAVAHLVEPLLYNQEGRGFNSRFLMASL